MVLERSPRTLVHCRGESLHEQILGLVDIHIRAVFDVGWAR